MTKNKERGSVLIEADENKIFCSKRCYEEFKAGKLNHGVDFFKAFRTTEDLLDNGLSLYCEISDTEAEEMKSIIDELDNKKETTSDVIVEVPMD